MHATALGDIAATEVHADILDTINTKTEYTSTTRLKITSQLLAKLDPSFSYNARDNEMLKKSGFIPYITGKVIHIWTLNKPLKTGNWKSVPLDAMYNILFSNNPACIICLSFLGTKQVSCPDCESKVNEITNMFLQ